MAPEDQLRRVLDRRDPAALAEFVARHQDLARADLVNWRDHPLGVSPLGYVAMMRYDTAAHVWRNIDGTGAMAQALIAAGAPVDGRPGTRETPLITAASYGDADVAAVLIAAGAELDTLARHDAGGVPNGSAVLHAAVFGMTDVLELLVAAGARIRSIEEAAAAGDIAGWLDPPPDPQQRLRALVMAVDHQRVDVIHQLVAMGTPIDEADEMFRRHPLRLASQNGRPASVSTLLTMGADPLRTDDSGVTPLDLCRLGRAGAADTEPFATVEALLLTAIAARRSS